MKKMLLFGANGQVGHELARRVRADRDVQLVALARGDVDLQNLAAIRDAIRAHTPRFIVNAAAYTAVDKAESEPEVAGAINATAPAVMAEEAKRLGALLVHYSTDYVFDGEKRSPYIEDDPTGPLNVYGRSKLAGDQAIIASGCAHLIFRVGWVYSTHRRNFLLTILRLAREGKPLRIVHDQIGAPTPASWVAEMTVRSLSNHALEGLFHLAPGGETTWHGFAQAICGALGLDCVVTAINTADYPAPARRPGYSVLSAVRFQAAAGTELIHWKDGLDGVASQIKQARLVGRPGE